jgi:hypothetical protein
LAGEHLFQPMHARTQLADLLFETARKVRVHCRQLYSLCYGISSENKVGFWDSPIKSWHLWLNRRSQSSFRWLQKLRAEVVPFQSWLIRAKLVRMNGCRLSFEVSHPCDRKTVAWMGHGALETVQTKGPRLKPCCFQGPEGPCSLRLAPAHAGRPAGIAYPLPRLFSLCGGGLLPWLRRGRWVGLRGLRP